MLRFDERSLDALIARAAWTAAKSTEDIAPHEYVVLGWDRDDVSEEEFWAFVEHIERAGRLEEWTPPAQWVRRWGGRPMTNRYLYRGEYAYWFTWPRGRAPMLNREHVSVQRRTPTRRPVSAARQSSTAPSNRSSQRFISGPPP